MFSKENRLRRDRDFKVVFKKGKGVYDKACGIRFMKNKLNDSRFAVVVGTKISKSAVKRNRIRRQYREIIKAHLKEIDSGVDVILLVGVEALHLDYGDKEKRLLKVFKKARVLK